MAENPKKESQNLKQSSEVTIQGLHDRIKKVEWEALPKKRLIAISIAAFEAVIELLFATREVDTLKRFAKVHRICNDLFAGLEKEARREFKN